MSGLRKEKKPTDHGGFGASKLQMTTRRLEMHCIVGCGAVGGTGTQVQGHSSGDGLTGHRN